MGCRIGQCGQARQFVICLACFLSTVRHHGGQQRCNKLCWLHDFLSDTILSLSTCGALIRPKRRDEGIATNQTHRLATARWLTRVAHMHCRSDTCEIHIYMLRFLHTRCRTMLRCLSTYGATHAMTRATEGLILSRRTRSALNGTSGSSLRLANFNCGTCGIGGTCWCNALSVHAWFAILTSVGTWV